MWVRYVHYHQRKTMSAQHYYMVTAFLRSFRLIVCVIYTPYGIPCAPSLQCVVLWRVLPLLLLHVLLMVAACCVMSCLVPLRSPTVCVCRLNMASLSVALCRVANGAIVKQQVEQYESRCDTYLNLVGWLIGQSDAMPPEKQADLCLHLADLICARWESYSSHSTGKYFSPSLRGFFRVFPVLRQIVLDRVGMVEASTWLHVLTQDSISAASGVSSLNAPFFTQDEFPQ